MAKNRARQLLVDVEPMCSGMIIGKSIFRLRWTLLWRGVDEPSGEFQGITFKLSAIAVAGYLEPM